MKIFLIFQAVIVYLMIGAVIGTVHCAVSGEDMDSLDTKAYIAGMAFAWPVFSIGFIAICLCHTIYDQILIPLYSVFSGPEEERNNLKTCSEKLDDAFEALARAKADAVTAKLQMEEARQRITCMKCDMWGTCKNLTDSADKLYICKRYNSG